VRYLIDTNCCIYLFTNHYPFLKQRVEATEQGDIGLSTIVFAELALGSMNGKTPPMAALERLIIQMPLLVFDEAAARAYSALPFRRARFDRLLAAHAASLGLGLITRNVNGFTDIASLHVEDWTI
jgi:tRNA(fMet)-specific endonuclease VapC